MLLVPAGLFGMVYLGCVQFAMYNMLFPRLFPSIRVFADLPLRAKLRDRAGISTCFKQIGLDMTSSTLLYFPCFYTFQAGFPNTGNSEPVYIKQSLFGNEEDLEIYLMRRSPPFFVIYFWF